MPDPPAQAPAAIRRASPSRKSRAAGTIPAPSTSRIAAQPWARVEWKAISASAASGAGISRRRTAVMIPSVPSEPIRRLLRSYPATSLRWGPPSAIVSPGGITASMPVTQAPVTPYLKAWGPPALVATLPPICDCSDAPGSGGSRARSRARGAARGGWGPRPRGGSRHSAGSSSRIARRRSSEQTTPPWSGTAPPARPVPPPRGIRGASRS